MHKGSKINNEVIRLEISLYIFVVVVIYLLLLEARRSKSHVGESLMYIEKRMGPNIESWEMPSGGIDFDGAV